MGPAGAVGPTGPQGPNVYRWTAPVMSGFIACAANTYYLMTDFNTAFNNGTLTAKLDGTSTAINQDVAIFTATSNCKLNQIVLWCMQSSAASRSIDIECYKYSMASGSTAWPVGTAVFPLTNVPLTVSGATYQVTLPASAGVTFAPGDRIVLSYKNTAALTQNTSVSGYMEFENIP